MQGVISRTFTNPTKWGNRYSFQINGSDIFYGTGKEQPPEAGTTVTFDEVQNGKYWEARNLQVRKDEPVRTGVQVSKAQTLDPKDNYWRRKEERDIEKEEERAAVQAVIELQSCRNSAIEFVKLLITPSANGEVGLKLPAQNKREEFLSALVTKYTGDFLKQNRNGLENNNGDERSEGDPAGQLQLDGSEEDGEWKVE